MIETNMTEPRMDKKGINKEGAPSLEAVEAAIEIVIREGQEVDHGLDGVILKVDLATIPSHERDLLEKNGVLPTNEANAAAIKILKIYNPGVGDKEFKAQKRAEEILAKERNVARIPNTTIARDQHIDSSTRDRLKSFGAKLEDRAEIIVMDFINGKDVGTIMYEFVLKKIGYDNEYIAALSYSQKEQLVGQELGFEIVNLGSAKTPQEIRSAQGLTHDRNEEKLFRYLKRQGMVIDPAVFIKIDNAIRILNKNGLYHNDLHKRNVMIDESGEVYIIDFGRSHSEKRDEDIPDTKFSEKWRKLSMSEEEEHEHQYAEEMAQMIKKQERMLSTLSHQERIRTLVNSTAAKGAEVLEAELARARGNDTRLEEFFIMLHILGQANEVDKSMLSAFITSLNNKERQFRPFESNKIKTLQKIGYLN